MLLDDFFYSWSESIIIEFSIILLSLFILQVAALAPLALLLVCDARLACTSDVHRTGYTHLTVKL